MDFLTLKDAAGVDQLRFNRKIPSPKELKRYENKDLNNYLNYYQNKKLALEVPYEEIKDIFNKGNISKIILE